MALRPARGRLAADFGEYAAARRPDLVRLCVLLGAPPHHAAVLADRALAVAGADWAELAAGDPDEELLGLVLEQRALDRTPWWEQVRPDEVLPPELSALDRLTPPARARLVWAALGHATADPADPPHAAPTAGSGLVADVARVAGGVPVPGPTGAVPARARSPRRLVVATVVGAVLVAALAVAVRPDGGPVTEPPLDRVRVSERPNPAPVAWYADGRIHLEGGVAPVPDVVALVEMGPGAVYLDGEGRVVSLAADGARTLLGRAAAAPGLLGNAVFGRVAWVTPDGVLEVADVADAAVVARREVDGPVAADGGAADGEAVRLVRMSGSVLRWTAAGRELEWDTEGGTFSDDVRGEGEGVLVDLVGSTELRQVDPESVGVSQLLGDQVVVLGTGGEISPRQQFVLTRSGEGGTGVRVVMVGTGEEIDSGTSAADIVLDARFTDADRITYLLADRAALPDAQGAGRVSSTGPLEVRSCQVRTGACEVHAAGPGAGDAAVLLAR